MTATVQLKEGEPFIPVKTRFLYLMFIDDSIHNHIARHRCIATNHRGDCGINRHNQWAWIVGNLVNETGCNPDEVSCVETEEGDRFAINGKIVAYLMEE